MITVLRRGYGKVPIETKEQLTYFCLYLATFYDFTILLIAGKSHFQLSLCAGWAVRGITKLR